MAVSAILVISSILVCIFSGAQCLRIHQLRPSKSKAPRIYLFILLLTLLLQFATWVVIFTTFLLRLFVPSRKQKSWKLPILSIITGSITQLIPVLLLICAFAALLARLLAFKAARPLASPTRLRMIKWGNGVLTLLLIVSWVLVTIFSRAVPDALSGKHSAYGGNTSSAYSTHESIQTRNIKLGYQLIHEGEDGDGGVGHLLQAFGQKERGIDMARLAQLAYAVTFACLTYSIMIHARKVNGYLLLPDQVLYVINTRIAPSFLFRSFYALIDALLPILLILLFDDPTHPTHPRHPNEPDPSKRPREEVRLFSPSVAVSLDGIICVIVSFTLIGLAIPRENWMEREVAHLVPGLDPLLVEQQQEGRRRRERYDQQHIEDEENLASAANASVNGRAGAGEEPSRWSRLWTPFTKQRTYGATKSRNVVTNEESGLPTYTSGH